MISTAAVSDLPIVESLRRIHASNATLGKFCAKVRVLLSWDKETVASSFMFFKILCAGKGVFAQEILFLLRQLLEERIAMISAGPN